MFHRYCRSPIPAIGFALWGLLCSSGGSLASPANEIVSAGPGAPEAPAQKDPDNANLQLLAAAERFELLTEQSFSAKPAQLEKLISRAVQVAAEVSPLLPPDAKSELETRLNVIAAAKKDERAMIALAAVEGYRILVSAAPPSKVPMAVSLLDYCGFRYDADLKSYPPRWADMQAAADFGLKQWALISGSVTEAKLKDDVENALRNMASAASNRSATAARRAVQAQLKLIDKLESHFNPA